MTEDQFKILAESLKNLEAKSDQQITLLAIQAVAGLETTKEKIAFLAKIGLDRNQIAQACNTTPGTVSVQLSQAKAKAKGKKNERK